ncbi:MAG: hypothetical protein ACYDDF_09790 [Thermoplasmatota archaeon]
MTNKKSAGFRPIEIRVDAPATAWLNSLHASSKDGRALKKSYEHALSLIATTFLHGEVVPIPKEPRFSGVTSLRCEDLGGDHRLLYTNIRVEEGTIALVIDVVTNREYNRLFPPPVGDVRVTARSHGVRLGFPRYHAGVRVPQMR